MHTSTLEHIKYAFYVSSVFCSRYAKQTLANGRLILFANAYKNTMKFISIQNVRAINESSVSEGFSNRIVYL